MRISDWSSDVCSSDLHVDAVGHMNAEALDGLAARPRTRLAHAGEDPVTGLGHGVALLSDSRRRALRARREADCALPGRGRPSRPSRTLRGGTPGVECTPAAGQFQAAVSPWRRAWFSS